MASSNLNAASIAASQTGATSASVSAALKGTPTTTAKTTVPTTTVKTTTPSSGSGSGTPAVYNTSNGTLTDYGKSIGATPMSGGKPITTTPTPTDKTIGDVLGTNGGGSLGLQDPGEKQNLTPEEEATIRQSILNGFQSEINATNSTYADILNNAKIAGAGKLGSNTAIEARRGLLGSDFGNAQTDNVNSANNQAYADIGHQQAQAIAGIMDKANTAANQAIADKNNAINGNYTAHIEYLNNKATRDIANAKSAAESIYNAINPATSKAYTPADLDPTVLNTLASKYGVSVQSIINSYNSVAQTAETAKANKEKLDAENIKAKADAEKASQVTVTNGSQVYTKQADGTYKLVANNPKTSVPKASTTLPKGTVVSGGAIVTPDKLTGLTSLLETGKLGNQQIGNARGIDGKADPVVYKAAYDAWVAIGALPKDFVAKYPPKDYVNPKAQGLPANLMPAKAKSGSRSSNGN